MMDRESIRTAMHEISVLYLQNRLFFAFQYFTVLFPFSFISYPLLMQDAWQYEKIAEVLGRGQGFVVRTEGDLEGALGAALREKKQFSLINVRLDVKDHSRALKRLRGRLG